ncbi:MAG TPA: glucosaminidase domain-containing protein [Cyclobacteriaceae bacterium]|nr:glucosaminidase domain-containing protein [Cyclobacteriaceae bacterium]
MQRGLRVILAVLLLAVGCKEKKLVLKTEVIQVDSLEQVILLDDTLVTPVTYTHLKGLEYQPVPKAKKLFISAILPSVLIAKYHLAEQRLKLHQLKDKNKWSDSDSLFYHDLKMRYKATDLENLLLRMATVPNSIVLAQAVVESGWGQSRFFKEGNNIFGMWSYNDNEPRIPAKFKRDDKRIHLRVYKNFSESIDDYFKTLGTARAYRELRHALKETNDPYQLLPHLRFYSERRNDYVVQLKKIIDQNNLVQYDKYTIDPKYLVEEE